MMSPVNSGFSECPFTSTWNLSPRCSLRFPFILLWVLWNWMPFRNSNYHVPSSFQILKLSILSSWNTALFLSKKLLASPSQEGYFRSQLKRLLHGAASRHWVKSDALLSFRLSSCLSPAFALSLVFPRDSCSEGAQIMFAALTRHLEQPWGMFG